MRHPYTVPRLSDADMLEQANATRAHLESRRTVRHFAPDPVPVAVIQQLVMSASTAPSGAHRQPWHFVAVRDLVTKQKIREAAEVEERRNYSGRMPEEWVKALAPLGTDANKPYLEVAPWLIAVFAQDRGTEGRNYYVSESVGIAVGMLLAAVHDAGLVAVTHTPNPMKFLKDILGRPSGERAYMLLAIGHPASECTVPDLHRKGPEQVLTVLG
jgi:iodotyrosine deiodinase